MCEMVFKEVVGEAFVCVGGREGLARRRSSFLFEIKYFLRLSIPLSSVVHHAAGGVKWLVVLQLSCLWQDGFALSF